MELYLKFFLNLKFNKNLFNFIEKEMINLAYQTDFWNHFKK